MLHAAAKYAHAEMDATYGSRRMCIELREQGVYVGRYGVRKIRDLRSNRAKIYAKHAFCTILSN
ncbi:IS3 family transposase [Rahnella sikkimica]|uniref:IS3 family transposase n=1 Tax=Rahnella sikkimica TaxID=1805933 RepID=UPI00350E3F39